MNVSILIDEFHLQSVLSLPFRQLHPHLPHNKARSSYSDLSFHGLVFLFLKFIKWNQTEFIFHYSSFHYFFCSICFWDYSTLSFLSCWIPFNYKNKLQIIYLSSPSPCLSSSADDQTQGLLHVNNVLYHQAIPPILICSLTMDISVIPTR